MEFKDYEDLSARKNLPNVPICANAREAGVKVEQRFYDVPPEATDIIPAENALRPGYVAAEGESPLFMPYVVHVAYGKQAKAGNKRVVLTIKQAEAAA